MITSRIIAELAAWRKRLPSWRQALQPVAGAPYQMTESELPAFVRQSPPAMRYYHLLRWMAWQHFPERELLQTYPQAPIPYAAFAAACLIKLDQGFPYMSTLRRYLVEHPALVWLLGFTLVKSSRYGWGFDAEASLPTARHFTRLLRQMPNACLQFLLDETVRLIQQELKTEVTAFGECVSLDTKHIIAWVKENNPKAYVPDRFDKTKQPAGDPDCRLGCKRRHNQSSAVEAPFLTPTHQSRPATSVAVGEYYWGYASGVVATKIPEWGEFVLAEFTQPFDCSDVSYFFPLMHATERRLGFRPRFGAFDAAFDAFYVYEFFHASAEDWHERFAAVPFSKRNTHPQTFDPQGHPLCAAGFPMRLQYTFTCRTTLVEHERAHYVCPLMASGSAVCPLLHPRWAKGGCTHRLPTSPGARVRHQIDRNSPLYHSVYKQRTATERINSQATELGIERPHLRNCQAIVNQNTLIYVLINLRALQRVRLRKAHPEDYAS
jgi:hypothetical protein